MSTFYSILVRLWANVLRQNFPIRLVTDRSAITAELKDEKSRRVEFFSAATDVLSALDNIGYKVMAGEVRHGETGN